jgi:hypothetical protein
LEGDEAATEAVRSLGAVRPKRSDEELQRLSKHLAYEIEMACWQAHYIEWQ